MMTSVKHLFKLGCTDYRIDPFRWSSSSHNENPYIQLTVNTKYVGGLAHAKCYNKFIFALVKRRFVHLFASEMNHRQLSINIKNVFAFCCSLAMNLLMCRLLNNMQVFPFFQ